MAGKKEVLQKEYEELLAKLGLRLRRPSTAFLQDSTKMLLNEILTGTQNEGSGTLSCKDIEDSVKRISKKGGDAISGDPPLRSIVSSLSKEIEQDLDRVNSHLNADILVELFPTGSFNAQARLTDSGILILINSGLMMFIYQMLMIMGLSLVFAKFDENGNPINSTIAGRSGYNDNEVIEALAEIVLAYLLYRNTLRATRFALPGGNKAWVLHSYLRSCEKFAVAHEYGHVLAGHLSSPRYVVNQTLFGELETIKKNWEEEFEADITAIEIMLSQFSKESNYENSEEIQYAVAGPLVFFRLDKFITRVTHEVLGLRNTQIVTDHPPAERRIEAVQHYCTQRILIPPEALFGKYNIFEAWLNKREDFVIDRIKQVL